MSQKRENSALESHGICPRDPVSRYYSQAWWWMECIVAVLGALGSGKKGVCFSYTSGDDRQDFLNQENAFNTCYQDIKSIIGALYFLSS